MLLKQNFTCWYEGQDEADGRDILALNVKEAARMAVNIWRNENIRELGGKTLIVYLKDESGHVSKVHVGPDQPSEAHP